MRFVESGKTGLTRASVEDERFNLVLAFAKVRRYSSK